MYPKIYLKNETDFAHNGLGFLKDVISCYVEEEHNSTFELEMTYRINGHLYEHLEKGNIIKAHASDRLKNQLFRIYKTIKKNENTIAVFAEHISYDLAHDTVKSLNIEMQSCEFALNSIFRQSDFCQHFTGYSDIQASGDYKMEQTDCLSAIVGQRGSIIDTFGNGAEILRDNFDIHVLNRRGKDQNVLIAYKKNMTGIEIEEDTTDLITRIYPFAKKTNEETNEEVVYTPTFGYIDSDKINYYEHPYSRFMDFSDKFEDGEEITDAKFRSICEKYFKDNKCDLPKTNYKIEFIPLAMTENYKDKYKVLEDVGLMDSVIIRDSRFNVDTEAKVVKTKYDVIREKYENIELGDPKTSLNDVIVGKPGADGKPGLDGADGADGKPGIDGIPGRPDEDGKTYYTWIRYADDEHGSGISDLPLGKEYIGIAYNKETPKESNNPKDYTWSKFKGDQGIPGAPGEDGVTLYTWIKYADDAQGNGMSDSSYNKEYIGIAYNQTSQQESTNPKDYTWTLIKGDQGIPGAPGEDGVTYYTWVKYADDNQGTNMTDDPTGKAWLGLAYNQTERQESTNPADYTWSLIKGEDGAPGVDGLPGLPGADGKTYYTWIKYADNELGAGMSNFPDGKEYIGIAYNKETNIESNNPKDYVWAKFKGEQGIPGAPGNDGTPGVNGADGKTYYTWIKYADTETGVGMSDNPAGKLYIGISYNNLSHVESDNPSDYAWSLIKGEDGRPGTNGADGVTYYTWIKYADDALGNGMSDSPTDKEYIGIAYNMTSREESSDASLYAWSLIKGEDGRPGINGTDGKTYYTWIKYSKYADGKDMQDSPENMTYMGIAYNKETATESTNPKDYAWSLIKGQDGTTYYTWIKYADDEFGNGMSDNSTGKEYIGIAYNQLSQIESTNPADYTWTKIKGDQGIPGRPGSDGVTLYTWVKYADDNLGTGMTDDPTGKAWLGLAFNKTTPQESNDYRDYTWSKIKGEDGQDGVDGDIGDFPDYLPDTPRITAKGLFGSIEVVWTYEAKVFLEYELYASQVANFTPNTSNLLFKGKASAFLHEVDCNQTWYYKVRAVNTHGNSTAFSAQASASTFKLDADNIENYIEELAIGHALIGSLDADKIVTGKLKATYLDTRELTVTDGNGNRTLYIDSYGRVYLNVTSLQVNSSDVATEQGVINKIEEAKKDTNKKIEQEVNDLNSTINDLNNYIEGAYRDGIITEAEKEALREHLKIVEREKDDITAQVEALKATVELRATAELNDLLRKQAEFDEAHTLFVNTIKQTIGLRRGNK